MADPLLNHQPCSVTMLVFFHRSVFIVCLDRCFYCVSSSVLTLVLFRSQHNVKFTDMFISNLRFPLPRLLRWLEQTSLSQTLSVLWDSLPFISLVSGLSSLLLRRCFCSCPFSSLDHKLHEAGTMTGFLIVGFSEPSIGTHWYFVELINEFEEQSLSSNFGYLVYKSQFSYQMEIHLPPHPSCRVLPRKIISCKW